LHPAAFLSPTNILTPDLQIRCIESLNPRPPDSMHRIIGYSRPLGWRPPSKGFYRPHSPPQPAKDCHRLPQASKPSDPSEGFYRASDPCPLFATGRHRLPQAGNSSDPSEGFYRASNPSPQSATARHRLPQTGKPSDPSEGFYRASNPSPQPATGCHRPANLLI
jgi:hypothetical protein